MTAALQLLAIPPDYLLIDAMQLDVMIEQKSLIKGDARSISIAASFDSCEKHIETLAWKSGTPFIRNTAWRATRVTARQTISKPFANTVLPAPSPFLRARARICLLGGRRHASATSPRDLIVVPAFVEHHSKPMPASKLLVSLFTTDGSRDHQLSLEGKLHLRGACRPAGRFSHGREGMAMERGGTVLAKGFEMVWRAVTLVARQAVLRINGVPLFHARVSMCFRKNRSCPRWKCSGHRP